MSIATTSAASLVVGRVRYSIVAILSYLVIVGKIKRLELKPRADA